MESYIEITFINNILICLVAYRSSAFLSFCKKNDHILFIGIILEQLLLVFLFDFSFLFYLYEVLFYVFFFSIHLKKGITYICIKYLLMFTQFKFYEGSFALLHYFVDVHFNVLGLWILYVFVYILLTKKWSYFIKVSDFIYPITIYAKKKIVVLAYLDTGNKLTYNEIPVIFLDMSYRNLFVHLKNEQINLNTLNGISEITIYLCKVKIDYHKVAQYYICCDKRVRLEFCCYALLNVNI